MPVRHDYVCVACGYADEHVCSIQQSPPQTRDCPQCKDTMRRRFAIPATPIAWIPHFNHSVGAFVSSEREFKDHLRRGSEEMSARLGGMKVNYEPIPIQEVSRDESYLEATKKERRDSGRDEARRTIIT